ncbi:hypothetical protein BHE74_00057198, partial [Ensete ventricosum]
KLPPPDSSSSSLSHLESLGRARGADRPNLRPFSLFGSGSRWSDLPSLPDRGWVDLGAHQDGLRWIHSRQRRR